MKSKSVTQELRNVCSYRKDKVRACYLTSSTYISTENMKNNREGVEPASSVPIEGSVTAYEPGDVLISNIRPYFKKIWKAKNRGGCSNDVLVFKAGESVDKDFLFYVLSDDTFFEFMMMSAKGTKMPRGDKKVIMSYPVPIFSIEKQRRIASILSALDDKIETNNAICRNLEEQAMALYKAWFVDFESLGKQRPSNWIEKDIYSICEIIYGAPFSSKQFNENKIGLPLIRIRDLKKQTSAVYTNEKHPKAYTIVAGDIVVGMDGEFTPHIWGGDEGLLNQRVCVFKNTRTKGNFFLYFSIKPLLFYIEQTEMATTVIHIGKNDFDSFRIWLPTSDVLNEFDNMVHPMYEEIVGRIRENKRLTALRDSLLPKLMSGDLSTEERDILIKD